MLIKRSEICSLLVLACILVFLTIASSTRGYSASKHSFNIATNNSLDRTSQTTEKTAEQANKNIQVFKGLPASQLLGAMFFMESSLGVSCNHCHVNFRDFDKDDNSTKQTARRMIQMVRDLNRTSFDGQEVITCNTCHRGQTRPVAPLAFAAVNESKIVKDGSSEAKEPLPTADQVFDHYLQSAGGKAMMAKITTRVMKGTRIASEGWSTPVEISQKAPNSWLSAFTLGKDTFKKAFDGTIGWNQDNHGIHDVRKEDLAALIAEADLDNVSKLRERYTHSTVTGRESVNGHLTYVVEGQLSGGALEKLYFDTSNGLLYRIASMDKSPLGPIPHAVDFDDYRNVDGIKLPFVISHLRADFSFVDRISEVKQNIEIDNKLFDKPHAP